MSLCQKTSDCKLYFAYDIYSIVDLDEKKYHALLISMNPVIEIWCEWCHHGALCSMDICDHPVSAIFSHNLGRNGSAHCRRKTQLSLQCQSLNVCWELAITLLTPLHKDCDKGTGQTYCTACMTERICTCDHVWDQHRQVCQSMCNIVWHLCHQLAERPSLH